MKNNEVEVRPSGRGHARRAEDAEPDVARHCPNCGHGGTWQKCKLICENPRCSVHIILACID